MCSALRQGQQKKAFPVLKFPPFGIGPTYLKASGDWEGMPRQDRRCVSCACRLSGSVADRWQARPVASDRARPGGGAAHT